MEKRVIDNHTLNAYCAYLKSEEKSAATCEKYLRDINRFAGFAADAEISKELVCEWKRSLLSQGYAVSSINSMLASVNSLFRFAGWSDCCVKNLRIQRSVFSSEEKMLTKSEYMRLLEAADNEQLRLVMETICCTGIRVSELKYFTVDGVKVGEIMVNCKNKFRTILIPGKLRKKLYAYMRKEGIKSGPVFLDNKGKALDRSRIWRRMKSLCAKAQVPASKVFPHNLRKLFARVFYKLEKDIVKLADILGHSSVNTTRIYIMSTGFEHRRLLESMGLIQ